MAGGGGWMRGLVIAAVLVVAGCHRAGDEVYRASLACAANEHVFRDFIDQTYDPANMQPAERARTLAFNRSALRLGRAAGRAGGAVKSDVEAQIAALRAHDAKVDVGTAAADALHVSNACQKKFGDAAGARAYRLETAEPRKRFWQE